MIRDIELSDFKDIKAIASDKYPIPEITDLSIIAAKTVSYDENPIAYGFLKLTTESILICNMNCCKLTRARAIRDLIITLIDELNKSSVPDSHVFICEEVDKTASFLSLFGFIPATGKAMYLPPRGKNG